MEENNKSEIVIKRIKEKKMSIPEFARSINIPYTTLVTILKKDLDSASLSNLVKICDGINMSITEIREMAGEVEPEVQPYSEEELNLARIISENNELKKINNLLIEANREDMYLVYELTKRLVLGK